jgi:metallo-beta-lactamase family protein
MPDPVAPDTVDYLLMESTYGDRQHDRANPQDALADIINKTIHRGGTVIIPAFAVGRAQSLLYHIGQLKAAHRLPKLLPIFLDSPMAIDATHLFQRHAADHRLDSFQLKLMDGDVRYIHTARTLKS